MKYYKINNSLDDKILGLWDQVDKVTTKCDVENPNFIDNFLFKKANSILITTDFLLKDKAELTDLINYRGIGVASKLLVSERLKLILQKYNDNQFQFFQSLVNYKKKVYPYWVVNPVEDNLQYIDFKNSEIWVCRAGWDKKEIISIASLQDFLATNQILRKGYKKDTDVHSLKIVKPKLKDGINSHFFALTKVDGGVGYYISDVLRSEIESTGCAGMAFKEIDNLKSI